MYRWNRAYKALSKPTAQGKALERASRQGLAPELHQVNSETGDESGCLFIDGLPEKV